MEGREMFFCIFIFLNFTCIYATQQTQPDAVLKNVADRVSAVRDVANNAVLRANEAMGYVFRTNEKTIEAFNRSNEALVIASQAVENSKQASQQQASVVQQAQNLGHEYERLTMDLKEKIATAEKTLTDAIRVEREHDLDVEKTKIEHQVYEKTAAAAEHEKWNNIKEILADPKPIIKIGAAVIAVALSIYAIKHGLPLLIDYFAQPQIISETSAHGWFDWFKNEPKDDMHDLIFSASLEAQLSDLLLRITSAQKYDEALPNILFYGPPGTGKTAFVKALAYASGLDYALTSGSEFAKITDLNLANNALRNLLHWAKNSKKGLIVFIDEAESLFAHRKLPTTCKVTQDFINTFLSLIPDQSQKNVMFIFATNHPFKLDDAITNRIGTTIEFALPAAGEREKILLMHLSKYAQENKNAIVALHKEFPFLLPTYAQSLEGFSPRAIKFIAQEMIIKARRGATKELTDDIVQFVIQQAKESLQTTTLWEQEREKWIEHLNLHRCSRWLL